MKREDFEAPPCQCPECTQAGVTDKSLRRDPRSGKWLHGYALKGVYLAEAEFWARVKRLGDAKALRGGTAHGHVDS